MLRLNENTYPVYMALQNRDIDNIHAHEQLERVYKGDCIKAVILASEVFHAIPPENHYYITEPFVDATEKAKDKLMPIIRDSDIDYHKRTIFKSALFMHHMGFAMHFLIKTGEDIHMEFFLFSRTQMIGYGRVPQVESSTWNNEQVIANLQAAKGYIAINPHIDTDETPYSLFMGLYHSYISILFFVEFCEVDTKIIAPKAKERIDGQKYYNEKGAKPITILDCRWFTELIRNIPFNVRGHLRWQPCGEGRKTRKLIWVEGFEKKGYHRKAQKTMSDSN